MNKHQQSILEILKFIESVLKTNDINKILQKEIYNSLDLIKARKKDSTLYLGIIGEFSSGKSTFINALLDNNILKTDVLQATTATPTLIKYSENVTLETLFNDGQKIVSDYFAVNNINENIEKYIHSITSKEEISKNIKLVSMNMPAKFLENGIVIVDTPGANANIRHEKITSWAIKQICDAAIIIFPATNILSESLISFIQNNLSDVIHRCIFVVTKLDAVIEGIRFRKKETDQERNEKLSKELKRLFKVTKSRIISNFKIKNPEIVYVAPQIYLDGLAEEENESKISYEIRNELTEKFKTGRNKIISILKKRKQLIIIEKIHLILNNLLANLNEELDLRKKKHEARHRKLEENRIPDLSTYIETEKNKYSIILKSKFKKFEKDLNKYVDHSKIKTLYEFKIIINKSTKDELVTFTQNDLPHYYETITKKAEEKIKKTRKKMQKLSKEIFTLFEVEFFALYKKLEPSENQTDAFKDKLPILKVNKNNLINTKNNINEFVKNQKIKTFKGIGGNLASGVIGGVIGQTFIPIPVVGAIIGGALGGWVASSFFSKSIEQHREIYLEKITAEHEIFYCKFQKSLIGGFRKVKKVYINNLNEAIDEYFIIYKEFVGKLIKDDKEAKKTLLKLQKKIKEDIVSINKYLKIFEKKFINSSDFYEQNELLVNEKKKNPDFSFINHFARKLDETEILDCDFKYYFKQRASIKKSIDKKHYKKAQKFIDNILKQNISDVQVVRFQNEIDKNS